MSEENGTGFAALAKQISVWTTKSLLTLLVLVVGLGFGRQVLKWWAADRSLPPGSCIIASSADGLGDPRQLHTIQFGDASWSLCRRSIAGDRLRAIEQLQAACREMLLNIKPRPVVAPQTPRPVGELPGETTGRGFMTDADRSEGAALASEEKFLAFLSGSTPVDQQPGRWRLYEFHEAFPMAVGVARPAATAAGQPAEAGPDLVRSGYRVVVWAVAVPMGTKGWTLCTFQPGVPSSEAASALVNIPLPPGGRRGLSLRAAGGGALIAFRGPYHPQEWKRFYHDWFQRQAWQTVANWKPAGAAWCAKFAAPDGSGSVDVRFGPDGRGGLSGLLMTTPSEAK